MRRIAFILITILNVSQCKVYGQWQLFYSNYSSDFRNAYFMSPETGFCAYDHHISPSSGGYGWITRTTDAANSWQEILHTATDLGEILSSVAGIRNAQCVFYIAGMRGNYSLNASVDAGNSWNTQASFDAGGSLAFALDESHFYIRTCTHFTQLPCEITLAGRGIATFTSSSPGSLFFTNELTGYLILRDSMQVVSIMKSTDGGVAWQPVFSDSALNIYNLFFASPQVGYAVGAGGKVIKTTDAGQSWQYLNTGVNDGLGPLYFTNDLVGYVAADSGKILHTTDGGLTWASEYIGAKDRVRQIYFVNDTFAFASTGSRVYSNYTKRVTGIENVTYEASGLSVYPNPAREEINIQFSGPTHGLDWKLNIIDCSGRLVKAIPIKADSENIQINTELFSPGIYVARVTDGNANFTSRFFIE